MTINGPEGLYIPDQRQVEAEINARIEADYWRSVAIHDSPVEVIKKVNQLSPQTFSGMTEAHDRLWEQLKAMGQRDRKLHALLQSQEDYLSRLSESFGGYDSINAAITAAVSGERERMDRACRSLGLELDELRARDEKTMERLNETWYADPSEDIPALTRHVRVRALPTIKVRLNGWKEATNELFPNHDKVPNKDTKYGGLLLPENKDYYKFFENVCEREALFKIDSEEIVKNIINVKEGLTVIRNACIAATGGCKLVDEKEFKLDYKALMACTVVANHLLSLKEKSDPNNSVATMATA